MKKRQGLQVLFYISNMLFNSKYLLKNRCFKFLKLKLAQGVAGEWDTEGEGSGYEPRYL